MEDIQPQWRLMGRRAIGLLAALALALSGAACGGDDETDADTAGSDERSTAAEERRVEEALRSYGQARGADTCEFVTQEYIDSQGGISRCARTFADSTATRYKIQSINVSGSKGSARGRNLTSKENFSIDLVLENGEWKVDPR